VAYHSRLPRRVGYSPPTNRSRNPADVKARPAQDILGAYLSRLSRKVGRFTITTGSTTGSRSPTQVHPNDSPKCFDAPAIPFVPRKIQSALAPPECWHCSVRTPALSFEYHLSKHAGHLLTTMLPFPVHSETLPPAQSYDDPEPVRAPLFHWLNSFRIRTSNKSGT
jgi:hypothetical protein